MASIGLFVGLSERVENSTRVDKVRKDILRRFYVDCSSALRVDIYRMIPLRSLEQVSSSDLLVAHVADSHLDANIIENIAESNRKLKEAVVKLSSEVSELTIRLARLDSTRKQAMETIDSLRSYFISLMEGGSDP
jgi:hypothetical protein